jgi:CHAD domain-containing protein
VPLSPDLSAGAAFAAIAYDCIEQVTHNEIVVRQSDDPEGVHQMRIGLRRLRAVIGAYRKHLPSAKLEEVTGELDWLQQELAVRDWDVFIEETLDHLSSRMPDDPALIAIVDAAKAIRAEGYAAMRRTLDERRYAILQLNLYRWLADLEQIGVRGGRDLAAKKTAGALARSALTKRYKRVTRLGGKNADLPEADLHRLRLQAKKLRYVAEFFRGLHPGKSAGRFIGAVAAVQDQLGSLNDALVSQRLLGQLGRRLRDGGQEDLAGRGIALVEGWQASRIDGDLRAFRQVWKQFRRKDPFWDESGSKS